MFQNKFVITILIALCFVSSASTSPQPNYSSTIRASVSFDGKEVGRGSREVAMSSTGRFVAFESKAKRLVSKDPELFHDVFLRDVEKNRTELISVSPRGRSGNSYSFEPVVSRDGRYVAFSSWATNLGPSDGPKDRDIFLRDRKESRTKLLTPGLVTDRRSRSKHPSISDDGRFVVFDSNDPALAPNGTRAKQVFLYDRRESSIGRISENTLGVPGDRASNWPSISPMAAL